MIVFASVFDPGNNFSALLPLAFSRSLESIARTPEQSKSNWLHEPFRAPENIRVIAYKLERI